MVLVTTIVAASLSAEPSFTPVGWVEAELTTDLDSLTLDVPAAALGAVLRLDPIDVRVVLDRGEVQEAQLGVTSGCLAARAGVFLSPIGLEVAPVHGNWSWSRGTLFAALPFDHAGARVSITRGAWTFTGALYTGWDDVDTNDEKSLAASVAFAWPEVSGQLLYFGGVERDGAWRHLFDGYVTVDLGWPELALHVDGGWETNDWDTNEWIGAALYARFPIVDGLRLALRGDVLSEAYGAAEPIFADGLHASGTATLDFHAVEHLRVMLEARFDHPSDDTRVTFGATAFF